MDVDVVVIGAGAAGLAAARALADAGASAVVLEARGRIGGRIWTDHRFGPVPVERGAEFIHGSQVRTWRWVREAGLGTAAAPPWEGRRFVLGPGRLAGPWLLRARPDLWRLPRIGADLAAHRGPDMSLAAWMDRRGLSPLARHILDVRLAHAACARPEALSVAALAHEERTGSSDSGNFRIVEGYDRALAAMAAGLDVRLGTPVRELRWSAGAAEAVTDAGAVRARRAVVTLPLALLKAARVAFSPALPAAKRNAIGALAMEPAMKLLLRFREPFWDRRMTFLTAGDPAPVWWVPRAGAPLLTAFLTGPRARRMAEAGEERALELALQVLERSFGAAPRRLLAASDVVDWGGDPWAMGGYSSTPPGSHGARAALAEPCGALQFAGEAAVPDDNPATVHGAMLSGERAAAAILEQLAPARRLR